MLCLHLGWWLSKKPERGTQGIRPDGHSAVMRAGSGPRGWLQVFLGCSGWALGNLFLDVIVWPAAVLPVFLVPEVALKRLLGECGEAGNLSNLEMPGRRSPTGLVCQKQRELDCSIK